MASCGDIEIASRPPLTAMISAILTMTIFKELEPHYARHLTGRELRQFHNAAEAHQRSAAEIRSSAHYVLEFPGSP